MKAKKTFSPQQKIKILRRHLVHRVPVDKLCAEYEVHPCMIFDWEAKFFDEGAKVFQDESFKQSLN